MNIKFLSTICAVILMMFCTVASAENSAHNWQLAYSDNITAFYFDISTVKTVGSPDVISVDLKMNISKAMLQNLPAEYKDKYDTSTWHKIKYCVSSTVYNRVDRNLITTNLRFYDLNNNLIAAIDNETKRVVSVDSVQTKIYAAIFQWLYEN
jgi:hypothetical protein